MGNDHARGVEHFQAVADDRLRAIIQSAGRLVEKDDPGLADDGARNQQALALSTGKTPSTLADDRVHPHGHGLEVILKSRQTRGHPSIIDGEYSVPYNIPENAACHQAGILHDDPNLSSGPPAHPDRPDPVRRNKSRLSPASGNV